jgi:hypothetical protein
MFGMMLGSVAGMFATRSEAKAEVAVYPYPAAVAFDPTKANRDEGGRAICRIYRAANDGTWREIQHADIQPGDKIVTIGQDGDRLWVADSMTVQSTFPPQTDDAGGVITEPGSVTRLISPPVAK